MKRFTLLMAALLIAGTSFAQIDFGVKAGVTSTSVNTDETMQNLQNQDYESLKVQGANAKVGFQGGVFGRIALLGIYVQPELLFSSTSSEVEVTKLYESQDPVSEVRTQEFQKLDFPIMAGFKFGPARIQVGPVGSLVLSGESAVSEVVEGYEQKFNSATWGYQAGVGLDLFNKLTVDLKYEGNLSKLGDEVSIGEQNYEIDSRASQWVLNVGFFF